MRSLGWIKGKKGEWGTEDVRGRRGRWRWRKKLKKGVLSRGGRRLVKKR